MTLLPVADRVVLKPIEAETTTKSGIILMAKTEDRGRTQMGEVLAVGPGGIVAGTEYNMYIKVGQKVIFNRFSGTEVKKDDEEYIIVRQDDIIGVIED